MELNRRPSPAPLSLHRNGRSNRKYERYNRMGRPNGGELHALQRRRKFGSRRVMKRGSVPNERHQKKKFDEHVTGQNVGRYIIGE